MSEIRMTSGISWPFYLCLWVSLTLTSLAVWKWGAVELRNSPGEIVFLTFVGFAWFIFATRLFPWFGLSLRDDAVERNNTAALVALCGAIVAVALTYIGGNLGEGPSFLNNFYSAGLATISLFGVWLVLELGAGLSVSIAEERDLASGLRLCAFLLAAGAVLGRAAAGDWHSTAATNRDFVHDGWPAGLLCAVAIVIERLVRPGRRHPFPAWPSAGFMPGLVYLGLAAGWLWHLGAWEGMPK